MWWYYIRLVGAAFIVGPLVLGKLYHLTAMRSARFCPVVVGLSLAVTLSTLSNTFLTQTIKLIAGCTSFGTAVSVVIAVYIYKKRRGPFYTELSFKEGVPDDIKRLLTTAGYELDPQPDVKIKVSKRREGTA